MTPIQIIACVIVGALLIAALVGTSLYVFVRILHHIDMAERAIAKADDYTGKEN